MQSQPWLDASGRLAHLGGRVLAHQGQNALAHEIDVAAQAIQPIGKRQGNRDLVDHLLDLVEPFQLHRIHLRTLLRRHVFQRLLDPNSDVTLSTLERAAALVGRKLSVTLV